MIITDLNVDRSLLLVICIGVRLQLSLQATSRKVWDFCTHFLHSGLKLRVTDDFGTDGDDTIHSKIADYPQPNDLQANASFPSDGSEPETVDLIFLDFIASYVIPALNSVGASYTTADVSYYLPKTFTTNSYLPAYAKIAWQANVPNCPVGEGVGYPN